MRYFPFLSQKERKVLTDSTLAKCKRFPFPLSYNIDQCLKVQKEKHGACNTPYDAERNAIIRVSLNQLIKEESEDGNMNAMKDEKGSHNDCVCVHNEGIN